MLVAIDASSSMECALDEHDTGRSRMDAVRAITLRVTDELAQPGDEQGLWIVRTSAVAPPSIHRLLDIEPATVRLRMRIKRRVARLVGTSEDTPLYHAIAAGLKTLQRGSARSVASMILMTDGVEHAVNPEAARRKLAGLSDERVRLLVVALGDICDKVLETIGSDDGGRRRSATRCFEVEDETQIAESSRAIVKCLRTLRGRTRHDAC